MDDTAAEGTGAVWTPDRGEQSERRGRIDRDSAGAGRGAMDDKAVPTDTTDDADLDARLIGPLDVEAQELLDEIVASVPKPLQPGEVTRKMVQAQLLENGIDLCESAVQKRLNRQVNTGKLRGRRLPSGERAYRRAEES